MGGHHLGWGLGSLIAPRCARWKTAAEMRWAPGWGPTATYTLTHKALAQGWLFLGPHRDTQCKHLFLWDSPPREGDDHTGQREAEPSTSNASS